MIFKKILQSLLLLSSAVLASPDGTCWVIDDNTTTLYTFNMQTLAAPTETVIDDINHGEGLAYRPSTHELYMWSYTDTIVRDADTGTVIRQYSTSYANEIEGASFYIDPITKVEELWVIVENNAANGLLRNERYIQRINIDTGDLLPGTRKKLHGGFIESHVDYGRDIGSLAIDPKTKTFWITKDSYTRKIANVNPVSGQITNDSILIPENTVDAEVLAFDINGVMYTESDRGDTSDDPRYLWKINPANNSMIQATPQFGNGTNGDLEGMACNSGADVVANNDYGDAPDVYPHVSHKISSNLYLGDTAPDAEDDQQSSVDATGDGADDNDGVVTLPTLRIGDTSFTVPLKVFNNTGEDAYITAWIDFDNDGIFQYDEALNTNNLNLPSSASSQIVNVTWDNSTDANITAIVSAIVGKSIMRIRISTSRVLRCDSEHNSTGGNVDSDYFVSPNGEVEDYEITIQPPLEKVTGRFNVERTNSGLITIIGSDERNAWYTQIVGRDFDYSILFYDENITTEKEIENITVKVELVDMDTNTTLYSRSAHIQDNPPKSRINISMPANDLAQLPATKNARFRLTYGIDDERNIIQKDCLSNPSLCPLKRTDYALDNFSIRPEKFYISISDNAVLRKENTTSTPLRVAAGYDYNLTVIASTFETNTTASLGYDASIIRLLNFDTTGTCANTDDDSSGVTFANGIYNELNFTYHNVGDYILTLQDKTWTQKDLNKTVADCIEDSSVISAHFNDLSGCNIDTISDINLTFYPHHFDVNFSMNNLPSSGHDDFMYMTDINLINNNVALQFLGSITAQSEDNSTTTNFTSGCVAQEVQLISNITTITTDGNNTNIRTIPNPLNNIREDINVSRMARFNNDPLAPLMFDSIRKIANSPLNITPARFKDNQNGTVTLDLRYNIKKHASIPINPIQLIVHSLDAASAPANSTAEGELAPNYVPSGTQDLNDIVRNFYFARVVSSFDNYPRVNLNISPIVRTPLNVDIYCKTTISNYCSDTNVTSHSSVSNTTREANGWYLSKEHNGTLDGNVTNLTANPPIVTITPDANPDPTINILMLNGGANGTVIERFINCSNPSSTINIETSPVLDFTPSQYVVKCTDINASQWSGIGQAGNTLTITPNVNKTGKMDW